MLANDDMIVNWWNMLQLDHRRIWWGSKTIDLEQKLYDDEIITEYWRWWETPMGMEACRGFHSDLLKRFAEEAATGNITVIMNPVVQKAGLIFCIFQPYSRRILFIWRSWHTAISYFLN